MEPRKYDSDIIFALVPRPSIRCFGWSAVSEFELAGKDCKMPRGYHVISWHSLMSSISTVTGKYVIITLTTRHNPHSSHQSLYTDGHSNSLPRNPGSFHVNNQCYLHDRMQKVGHSTWRHHYLPQSWGALRTTRFCLPWMFDKGLDIKRMQDRVRRDMSWHDIGKLGLVCLEWLTRGWIQKECRAK